LLALLFGGAGAWGYERFMPRPTPPKPPETPTTAAEDPEARKGLSALEGRVKDLSDRCNDMAAAYNRIQNRAAETSRSAPPPDLGPIEQKVAQVDRLSQQVEALGKTVAPLSEQLEQYRRRLADLSEELDTLRMQGTVARGRMPAGRDRQLGLAGGADRPAPAAGVADRPAPAAGRDAPARADAVDRPAAAPAETEKGELAGPTLQTAEEQFRAKRYGEAYASFRKLLQGEPDDARLWYYAALAYGLNNRDWGRTTQAMAEEGVAREKAGKPPRPEIDAAFSGLTNETGKDWLGFYRQRAQ
jgi:TolA-binding protein